MLEIILTPFMLCHIYDTSVVKTLGHAKTNTATTTNLTNNLKEIIIIDQRPIQ